MKFKLIFKLIGMTCIGLFPMQLHALSIVPPASNIEVVGFLTLEGKPIRYAKLELRRESCFGEVSSTTWSDEKGYYRLFEPSAFRAVYIYVQTSGQPANTYCLFEGVSGFNNAASHNKINYSIRLNPETFIKGYLADAAGTPKLQQAIMECNAKGGIWGELKPKQFGCNLKFKDAGKSCTDASQCLGKICFSAPQIGIIYPDPNMPKSTGFCPSNTYQALNKRSGDINGEYKAGKVVLYSTSQ